ncbi:MAG: MBL fold metallo-hydrolase [Deltaproteobacteria bacterium]|nr:MBL fold metallo-hydrolase [Deltaproteobacteria bacterium]
MPLKATYLGHASVLLENEEVKVMTDPLFSEKIFFLRRHTPVGIDPSNLPPLDAILISHAHYDHLDIPSFKYIPSSVPIVLPPGLAKLVGKFLRNPLIELETGRSTEIKKGLLIKAFPVRHYGFRLLPFRYTHCNGYLIKMNEETAFFPGDTAYRSDFGSFFPDEKIDLALLPIAAYKPRWLMKGRHMNPEEAVRVFEEIQAKQMIPIHWGAFKLSTEPMEEPIGWIKKIAGEKQLQAQIQILNPGEAWASSEVLRLVESKQIRS